MAATYYMKPKWLRGNSAKFPWTDKWKEAASQSSTKAGQLVYLVAATYVGKITISAVTSVLIWGILKEDCSGTENTLKEVEVIESGDILEISYADAFLTVPPVVGYYYDLINTGGQSYLATTYANPVFVVRKITDTTKHRCEVSVLSTVLQACVGKSS